MCHVRLRGDLCRAACIDGSVKYRGQEFAFRPLELAPQRHISSLYEPSNSGKNFLYCN